MDPSFKMSGTTKPATQHYIPDCMCFMTCPDTTATVTTTMTITASSTTTVIFFRSWDYTMMVTPVPTIIMMTEVELSSFTHKLKQCIRLHLPVQLLSSMKNMKANEGTSTEAVK
jgi:hypothetical protein